MTANCQVSYYLCCSEQCIPSRPPNHTIGKWTPPSRPQTPSHFYPSIHWKSRRIYQRGDVHLLYFDRVERTREFLVIDLHSLGHCCSHSPVQNEWEWLFFARLSNILKTCELQMIWCFLYSFTGLAPYAYAILRKSMKQLVGSTHHIDDGVHGGIEQIRLVFW